jgi:hypothetical protein
MGTLDSAIVTKTPIVGSYSYTDAGGEQTFLEILTGLPRVLCGGWIDASVMTKDGTIKLYNKIDGTNYRLVTTIAVTALTPGTFINMVMGINNGFKLTWTESADEAAARTIYYSIVGI